ncbi:MAG TPA: VOC family protein [Planctomycetota bacterium]|nr:VOC family protein [Planctomycetota bacterium]
MTQRPRLLASTPLLVVADLQRSIAFYRDQLGFGAPSVWGEPPCFAMLHRDGFELMLSLADGKSRVQPNGPGGTWDVYLRVADVAAEARALAEANVALAKGPTATFYGMREIEVLDPDGHRLCFAQDLGQTAATWDGVLDIGGRQLRLVLQVLAAADGSLRASLDSPDQGAMQLPVDAIRRDGGMLRLQLQAIAATYEGVTSADGTTVSGTWSQRGHR